MRIVRTLSALFITLCAACTPAQIQQASRVSVLPGESPSVVIGTAARVVAPDPVLSFLRFAQTLHDEPFLVCTRAHESDTAGGYRAYSSAGPYFGAYQYLQHTWDYASIHYGAPQYSGWDVRNVPGFWQDVVTWNYYLAVGNGPWAHRC